MKTKTTLVGIIISLLLVLPAAASDFTLDIFGNANEDDTINIQDVTYTEQTILEYKEETQFADAKHDGEIDILDVTQIELIILGAEKELVLIDCDGETTTVQKPIETMVVVTDGLGELTRIVGAKDKVIGVDTMIIDQLVFFPDLSTKPGVGKRFDLDVEALLELEPDLVLLGRRGWYTPGLEEKLKGSDIDVIRLGAWGPDGGLVTVGMLGYVLGKDEVHNAREYREWYDDYADLLNERISGIPEDEKIKVLLSSMHGGTPPTGHLNIFVGGSVPEVSLEMAGGNNIAKDIVDVEGYIGIEVEWIMEQNPEIILSECWGVDYDTDDTGIMREVHDGLMGKTALQNVKAIENDRIYVTGLLWSPQPVMSLYMAKWFYPDLFEDLDPQKAHQEYLDRFQGIDYDLNEHGTFVYHPNQHPGGS